MTENEVTRQNSEAKVFIRMSFIQDAKETLERVVRPGPRVTLSLAASTPISPRACTWPCLLGREANLHGGTTGL